MLVHCNVQGTVTTYTKTVETEHVRKGGYYFNRKKTDILVSWVERGRVGSKNGLCFCRKFNIQAFIFTSP